MNSAPSITHYMAGIWGSLFPGGGDTTALSLAMVTLNTAVMALIGSYILFILLQAVVASAHEGVPLGQKMHSAWVPVRVAIGCALAVPAIGGYTGTEWLVSQVVQGGEELANTVWSVSGAAALSSTVPVASFTNNSAETLTKDAFEMAICRALTNAKYAVPGDPTGVIALAPPEHSTFNGVEQWFQAPSPKTDISPDFCGHIEYALQGGAYDQVHIDAITNTVNETDAYVQKAIAWVRQGSEITDQSNAPTTDQIRAIINEHNNTVQSGVTAALQQSLSSEDAAKRALTTAGLIHDGWLSAGLYYNRVSQANGELAKLTSAQGVYTGATGVKEKVLGGISYEDAAMAATLYSMWDKATGSSVSTTAGKQNGTALKETVSEDKKSDSSFFAKFMKEISDNITQLQLSVVKLIKVNAADPIAGLVNIGFTILGGVYACEIGTAVASAAAGATVLGGTALLSAMAGPFGQSINNHFQMAELFGVALAYGVPLLFYGTWLVSVVSYMVQVCEVLVSVTLWIFAIVDVTGEGILSSTAKEGAKLVLGLFLRPSLMIVALLVAMATSSAGIDFLNFSFTIAVADSKANTSMIASTGNILSSFTGLLAYLGAYTILACMIVMSSCQLIHYLPQNVLKWIGAESADGGATAAQGVRGLAAQFNSTRAAGGSPKPPGDGGGKADPDGGGPKPHAPTEARQAPLDTHAALSPPSNNYGDSGADPVQIEMATPKPAPPSGGGASLALPAPSKAEAKAPANDDAGDAPPPPEAPPPSRRKGGFGSLGGSDDI